LTVIKVAQSELGTKFQELCHQVVSESGLELYDVEYSAGRQTWTVFVRDPATKTATIEDCIKVDRALSPHIDTLSWIPEELTLEVSSPGVYRHLVKLEHFVESVGEIVCLQFVSKLMGSETRAIPKSLSGQKKMVGKLLKANDSSFVVEGPNGELTFTYEELKKANLEPSFDELLRSSERMDA
jgi:ribosome maturation factor RimP